jgi:hypothetical protein
MSSKVVFSNKNIFGKGFRPNRDASFCKISKKLVENHFLNTKGMIDISNKASAWTLDALWSYIYYLYIYNRSNLDVFNAMSDPKTGNASAQRFVDVIHSFFEHSNSNNTIDVPTLILFINNIIDAYQTRLVNPLFDFLQSSFVPKANTGYIKTNVSKNNTLIDPSGDANIKIKIIR